MTIANEHLSVTQFQPFTRFIIAVKRIMRHLIDKRHEHLTKTAIQRIPEKFRVDLGLNDGGSSEAGSSIRRVKPLRTVN